MTTIPAGEIKQWYTTKLYGNHTNEISDHSNLSWLKMPIISLACERRNILPLFAVPVPSKEREFWETYFMPEILHLEERLGSNIKEPSLELRGDPKYHQMRKRKLLEILLDENSWDGRENLRDDLQTLILGIGAEIELYEKKMDILDCIHGRISRKETNMEEKLTYASELTELQKRLSVPRPSSAPGVRKSIKSLPLLSPLSNSTKSNSTKSNSTKSKRPKGKSNIPSSTIKTKKSKAFSI